MTIGELEAGRSYVIGTYFCWPPSYARAAKTGWRWTRDLGQATAFKSAKDARRCLERDRKLTESMTVLDPEAWGRVKVLKADLKIGLAED